MRNLLPYGISVLVVAGAAFAASYFLAGGKGSHPPAPVVRPLAVAESSATIPLLSMRVAPLPTSLAVTKAIVAVQPVRPPVTSSHPAVAPATHAPTTTIIIQGGSG